jgi:glycosyltransferase involved in cell wall biosynthesis
MSDRPRLLVLASTYPRWEDDPEPAFVHELAKRLVPDFDVLVLTPHAPGAAVEQTLEGVRVVRYRYAPASVEMLVSGGGIVANLRATGWKWMLVPLFLCAQMFATWKWMRTWKPAVVHAHWLIPQGFVAALARRMLGVHTPLLVTSHGADLFALRGSVADAMKRFVLAQAAAVTVVSETMRHSVVALGRDPAIVSVEPMGVDLSVRFAPDAAAARSAGELLFVGRLVEKKGLRVLIDAMPAVLRARPDTTLTIAGFGPEEAERRAQVRALGLDAAVRFIGPIRQAELPALYRRAAVFVAPFVEAASGDQEGLGLVAIEAAGCGCPVVYSALPATRDALPPGGPHRAVPPGDAAALATALIDTLQSPAATNDTFLAALRDRYDWRARAASYRALLDRLQVAP